MSETTDPFADYLRRPADPKLLAMCAEIAKRLPMPPLTDDEIKAVAEEMVREGCEWDSLTVHYPNGRPHAAPSAAGDET